MSALALIHYPPARSGTPISVALYRAFASLIVIVFSISGIRWIHATFGDDAHQQQRLCVTIGLSITIKPKTALSPVDRQHIVHLDCGLRRSASVQCDVKVGGPYCRREMRSGVATNPLRTFQLVTPIQARNVVVVLQCACQKWASHLHGPAFLDAHGCPRSCTQVETSC